MPDGTRCSWVALVLAAALGCATGSLVCSSLRSPSLNWVRSTVSRRGSPAAGGSILPPQPGAKEAWPVSRTLHCDVSGWQQQYLEVHRQIISRRAPPRFMLAYGLNGLGDSLRGAVTLFWLAVLQQRAFAMQFGELGAYEWAFDQPHFNWSWSPDYIYPNHTLHFQLDAAHLESWEAKTLEHGDVRAIGKDHTTVAVSSHQGYMRALLNNPHHKAELADMGLNPYNVYACGVDFLLRLNQPALQPYAEEYALLTEPAALKIGIHIRVGDNQLVGHAPAANITDFEAWFDCADQIETSQRQSPDQVVRWFLATDSLALRTQAKAAYGDKVVTKVHAQLGHTRAEFTHAAADDRIGGRNNSHMKLDFQSAAAELWLLSLTDFQVVTTHSVYGRLAASMSGKFNQMFGIEYAKELGIEYAKKLQNRPTKQDCTNGDYKPVWMF